MATVDATVSIMVPVEVNDTTLTSTTVAETDYSQWLIGTTYALADMVIDTTTHRIYESAQASNTGNDPTDVANRTGEAPWWIDVSATNAWKMFDGQSASATVEALTLTIVVKPGFASSIYMGGLIGDSATVVMTSSPGGTEVYNETIQLENSLPGDYYEYFFSPFTQQPDLVVNDLPPYLNGEVTITLTISAGYVECGMFRIGDLRPIGLTSYNSEVIPKTYSYIDIDEFGNNKIVPRNKAKDMRIPVVVEIAASDSVVDLMTSVLDVPSVVVGTTLDDHAALRGFGLVSGSMKYLKPGLNSLSLQVKGLI